MRNSTGSPIFSDFKSDLSRVVRSRPLVKGNEDPGYEGVSNHPAHQTFALMGLMHNYVIQCMRVRLGGIAKQIPPFFRECVFLFYILATNIRL